MRKLFFLFVLLVFIAALHGCDEAENKLYEPTFSDTPLHEKIVYVFGVHPLHNPKRLLKIYGPVTDYLSRNIPGAEFRLEASRNYAAYDEKLYGRQFHFALPNPYQTISSLNFGYRVFGKMADDENFRGIILVRKDSGITRVEQLRGKTVCFPAPTALAATMMPQYFLQTHGLDINSEITVRYVGSQESSIMNVYLGEAAAGATWPPPWRALTKERPELAEELEVRWVTDPLPNNGLVVRDDVPDEVAEQVAGLLFGLDENLEGRQWLAQMELSSFVPATNHDYQPVREFLVHFEEKVRILDNTVMTESRETK